MDFGPLPLTLRLDGFLLNLLKFKVLPFTEVQVTLDYPQFKSGAIREWTIEDRRKVAGDVERLLLDLKGTEWVGYNKCKFSSMISS